MRKLVIGLLLALSVFAAGCNQPTVEEATDAFCQNLQAFGDALENLDAVSATSSVGDLKDATAEVEKAWNEVTQSAKDLNEVKLDTIDESWKNLRQTVDQIDSDDTLAAAAANISVSMDQVQSAYNQVGEVACPGLTLAPTAQVPTGDVPPVEPAAAEVEPPGLTGAYSTTLMLAGSTETEMVLVVNEDNSVFLVMRPVGGTNETIVLGGWQDNGDGTATVTLHEMMNGDQLATPETLSFRLEGDQLVAFQFDETVYGTGGFSLQRMQDTAVAEEAAAVAMQASSGITATAPITSTAPVTTTEATALLPDLSGAAAEPASPVEPELAASPLGRTWQLQQITQTSGVNYTPVDPALYTVTFNADSTLNVVADCNTGTGTFQASESGTLTIDLVIANAYCAAGSLSNQFISYLNVANSYDVEGDQLVIGFSNDYGLMSFTAAP